jgi:hypothetical protein
MMTFYDKEKTGFYGISMNKFIQFLKTRYYLKGVLFELTFFSKIMMIL